MSVWQAEKRYDACSSLLPHLLPAVISDSFNSAVLSIPQSDEDADLFTHTEILHSNHLRKKKDNIFYSISDPLAVSSC